jgi:hypothetical protein
MASTVDAYTRPERPRQRSASATRDLLLALPFLALVYVQIAHHVMWRDELNALAIAWNSPTIPSLFWHIHREGHPWLWYLILWIPSRFTQSVLLLKVVQGIVSTAIILFVALRSPFRTWEKALVLAGYFFVFEYTVLSRMYGVMLLFFVVYLWGRAMKPESPIPSAVLLGLIASVDTIGIMLSFALLLEYAYTAFMRRRTSPLFSRKTASAALAIYAAILLLAVWSARPAADISWRTTGRPFKDAKSMSHLYDAFLHYTILPFIPVKSPRSHFFWNPDLHVGGHLYMFAYTMAMLVILGMLYISFRKQRNLLLLIGLSILAGTAFRHFIYPGYERHFGIVFLAFLAAAWIVRAESPSLLPMAVYILLAISVLSGVWATIGSWKRPFSYNQAAAQWIVANHLENMPLVGEEDTSVIGVAEYLQRPIYQIECSCVDTYLLFSSRRDDFTKSDAPRRILQAAHFYHDAPLLFVRAFPMKPDEEEGLKREGFQIETLATFTEAEEIAENFYLYRLTLIDAARNRTAAASSTAAPWAMPFLRYS